MVKRWVNEAQEAASSDNIMVQVRGKTSKGIAHCHYPTATSSGGLCLGQALILLSLGVEDGGLGRNSQGNPWVFRSFSLDAADITKYIER